ncbi:MAG: hypothetical protein RBQ97_02525 [Acholeplasma sp.]|nr:hypothetical protein [Acholeplasma sp.]
MQEYRIKNYQNKKTFSSFLSGIAGKMGVPIWAFYINRGQLISSFGVRDKNGAIMEFFPANGAYLFASKIGFRSFVKIENKVYEFFESPNENQTLIIKRDQVQIIEMNKELKIEYRVTYFTLPNEKNGALVRKVEIVNHGSKRDIQIVDGLTQILPAGIDYGGYKSISNLLQSWMQVINNQNTLFYKLRATTGDSSEIGTVTDGNYYFSVMKDNVQYKYIYDYKIIFGEDSTLSKPYNLMNTDLSDLVSLNQVGVNQVPSAFTAVNTKIDKNLNFFSLIGYSENFEQLVKEKERFNYELLVNKEIDNEKVHDEITNRITTNTNLPLFDEYMKQNMLDNVLRGGIPLVFETKNRVCGYHIYSRKHGDLERDYNFFSIEQKFYSQGNGNFRDVLQNRRNDLMFVPEIKDSNLIQFASLIQADGYNPLSIEGLKFLYIGKKKYEKEINELLINEFTPGDLSMLLYRLKKDVEVTMKEILKESTPIIKASFGEGYWEDHFTYLYDVLESVINIYPDQVEEILFFNKEYLYYVSEAYVKPRNEKYVLTKEGKVRQYDAVEHITKDKDWLEDKHNNLIKVNLIGKLLTLISNKFAHLDPQSIGLSYEANKPGWNDAMNGLPGLFASGVSETIELSKLVKYIIKLTKNQDDNNVYLLDSTFDFIQKLTKIPYSEYLSYWEKRMTVLEEYRKNLRFEEKQTEVKVLFKEFKQFLDNVDKVLDFSIAKANKIDEIIPTYLVYEVEDYKKLNDKNVDPKTFNLYKVPSFLEGPARYIKTLKSSKTAKELYDKVKKSELYDEKLKFYKTSIDLTNESPEIGRIHAFTKGWLERESNFLHMTYKYLLGLLKVGLYEEFFEEIKTNYTCFMDENVYGRSPLENSSFIAPSNNPDFRKHGQGFVARLSGSTAEMLSMWNLMFFGEQLFKIDEQGLMFTPNPKLAKEFFKNSLVSTKLFSTIDYEIINKDNIDTYDKNAVIHQIEMFDGKETKIVIGSKVQGDWAIKIREKKVLKIKVYIIREERK